MKILPGSIHLLQNKCPQLVICMSVPEDFVGLVRHLLQCTQSVIVEFLCCSLFAYSLLKFCIVVFNYMRN